MRDEAVEAQDGDRAAHGRSRRLSATYRRLDLVRRLDDARGPQGQQLQDRFQLPRHNHPRPGADFADDVVDAVRHSTSRRSITSSSSGKLWTPTAETALGGAKDADCPVTPVAVPAPSARTRPVRA